MNPDPSFHPIDRQGAQALLQGKDALLLDVRDSGAYLAGHIEGAVHLSMDNAAPYLVRTPKDRPVLIYCYRGNASQTYAQMFVDFGFREVYSLDQGYDGWLAAGADTKTSVDVRLAAWLASQSFGPDINAAGEYGMTPLMRACRLGEAAIVRALLRQGPGWTRQTSTAIKPCGWLASGKARKCWSCLSGPAPS